MYDAIIIGGGIVGAMVARTLSRFKLKICMLEKENDVSMGATKANSAIVHAGFDAPEGSLKAKLNVKGSQMMEKVCSELGVKYKKNGSLVIGFNEDDEKVIHSLYERGCRNGVKNLEVIDAEDLRKLEKNISEKVTSALYAPTGAIVCPYELCIAAIGNAMDNGADLLTNFKVVSIEEKNGIYKVLSANEKRVEGKIVINAAGLYSDEIAKMVGDLSFRVHPRKGEYLLLDKDGDTMLSHTVFRVPGKGGKGILLSPTVDSNVILGPTSFDMEDKEDKSTSYEGFEKIRKEAKENFPNVTFANVITSFCGLRAAGDTGDFIITSPKKGFVNLGGIESPGLSASPAIGEMVKDILKEQGFSLEEKKDYNPKREPMHKFRELTDEEKNEIIKKNPSYGKVVCRCEGITEGEILEAIRRNPKATDLDAIKRRTRAQMGRCQGGFCSPVITELIAQQLKIPLEKVTKSGGDSYICTGKTKE